MRINKILVGIAVVLFSSFAFAWGVSSTPTPIYVPSGTSTLFYTSLQNMMGNKTLTIEVSLDGDDIAKLSSDQRTYVVAPGTKKMPVYVNVTIPKGVPDDTRYHFSVHYREVPGEYTGEGTGVVITGARTVKVEVIVGRKGGETLEEFTVKQFGKRQTVRQGDALVYGITTFGLITIAIGGIFLWKRRQEQLWGYYS